jgi:D-glycero-D-manno-heptose 1,7-bisphosphate phosphatase
MGGNLPYRLHQTAQDFHIDLSKSYLVGDKLTDIQAGNLAGCKTVLVKTGYGAEESEIKQEQIKPDRIALDLVDLIDWILTQSSDL